VLPIRELCDLARQLDAFMFARQMGPFALMQRPAGPPQKAPRWLRSTLPMRPSNVQSEPAPVDFQDLLVATLPPSPTDAVELVIGRGASADLVLEDPAVSSRHAAIRWSSGTATLIELGSANGTFLNGLKLGTRAVLKSGDQLAFGRSHFVYVLTTELHARLLRNAPAS
jgi:hypothetical protein